jgi:large subunit ribosomal protein L29
VSAAKDLRSLPDGDLEKKQGELSEELFNLKFRYKLGQLENPLKLRTLRKDIARVKTILNEKKAGAGHGTK